MIDTNRHQTRASSGDRLHAHVRTSTEHTIIVWHALPRPAVRGGPDRRRPSRLIGTNSYESRTSSRNRDHRLVASAAKHTFVMVDPLPRKTIGRGPYSRGTKAHVYADTDQPWSARGHRVHRLKPIASERFLGMRYSLPGSAVK